MKNKRDRDKILTLGKQLYEALEEMDTAERLLCESRDKVKDLSLRLGINLNEVKKWIDSYPTTIPFNAPTGKPIQSSPQKTITERTTVKFYNGGIPVRIWSYFLTNKDATVNISTLSRSLNEGFASTARALYRMEQEKLVLRSHGDKYSKNPNHPPVIMPKL
ncbi:MAG: hypothetical protein WCV82_04120 [Candidatus Paceibacterota bacterium]